MIYMATTKCHIGWYVVGNWEDPSTLSITMCNDEIYNIRPPSHQSSTSYNKPESIRNAIDSSTLFLLFLSSQTSNYK